MKWRWSNLALVILLFAGCAHVPKESVELSATIGRDLAEVHRAHRELVQILFARMRHDINRFVDEVYAPYQISYVMTRQKEFAESPNAEEQSKSLLLAINAAFEPGAAPELQDVVLKGMASMVSMIRNNVESMRHELLDPIATQEAEVLGSVDRAYQQLHYANSIVTGHLSSVVKVHEVQDELLQAIGVDRDLRKEIGENLAMASDRIADLAESAELGDQKLENALDNAEKLKAAVNELKQNLEQSRQEE